MRIVHICDLPNCGQEVKAWSDQIVVDVVSQMGQHRFNYHVECWKQAPTVDPMPGVMIRVQRPTLHPTMRHRRTEIPPVVAVAAVVPLQSKEETAPVSVVESEETGE